MRCFAFALGFLCAAASIGCVRSYRPPSQDEPHAVLKLRRNYEHVAGTGLRETVEIEGYRAYHQESPAGAASAPRIDAILVHPTAAPTSVRALFFHTEMRMVNESYTEQVPHYETESYNCGTGTSYRTCTRSVTRYRSETKYRLVNKEVEVPDGECASSLTFAPAVGHVYLLQYTYRDHQACSLSCFEQFPLPGGAFQNQPCPMPVSAE